MPERRLPHTARVDAAVPPFDSTCRSTMVADQPQAVTQRNGQSDRFAQHCLNRIDVIAEGSRIFLEIAQAAR